MNRFESPAKKLLLILNFIIAKFLSQNPAPAVLILPHGINIKTTGK